MPHTRASEEWRRVSAGTLVKYEFELKRWRVGRPWDPGIGVKHGADVEDVMLDVMVQVGGLGSGSTGARRRAATEESFEQKATAMFQTVSSAFRDAPGSPALRPPVRMAVEPPPPRFEVDLTFKTTAGSDAVSSLCSLCTYAHSPHGSFELNCERI